MFYGHFGGQSNDGQGVSKTKGLEFEWNGCRNGGVVFHAVVQVVCPVAYIIPIVIQAFFDQVYVNGFGFQVQDGLGDGGRAGNRFHCIGRQNPVDGFTELDTDVTDFVDFPLDKGFRMGSNWMGFLVSGTALKEADGNAGMGFYHVIICETDIISSNTRTAPTGGVTGVAEEDGT